MQSKRRRAALTCALIGLSAGCGSPVVDPTCTDEARPGIVLVLEDARTGARQPFSDVIAIATDRAFGDTARFARITTDVSVPQLIALAHERPGTYEVTVHAAGYLTATVRDVAVQQERACRHVITRGLIVRLEPR